MSFRRWVKTYAWSIVLFCIGIAYYLLIQISLTDSTHNRGMPRGYSFSLHTLVPQHAKLHLRAKRNELYALVCGKTTIDFPLRERLWFEKESEEVIIPLKRGETSCQLSLRQGVTWFKLQVEQKLSYVDYAILSLLLGVPLYLWLFRFLMLGLTWLKSKKFLKPLTIETPHTVKSKWVYGIWSLLVIGVVIRIFYFHHFGISAFQHDWHGHIAFIKYIQSHWELPLGSKGLQFPQQPLYYLLSAGLYTLERMLGANDTEALYGLGYVALFCSIVFLYYGYRFFTQLTTNLWVQAVAVVFIAFTPSLIYMSARINNDVLVMALSAYTLFYMAKSYHSAFENYFYRTLIGVSLLFITKLSTLSFEVLLFMLLILLYLRTEREKEIEKKIFIFGIVGLFLLGFTLLRAYLPIEESYLFVNSSARFPGQMITPLGLDYFSSFHLLELIQRAYSYIFGIDAIRYSFLTYQYGTLLFGEFNYGSYIEHIEGLKPIMQSLILFGLFSIVGFVTYLVFLYRQTFFEKSLFALLLINFILIMKFLFTYPVVCNSDFRYYVPSFLLIAFFIAKGLSYLGIYTWLRYALGAIVLLFAVSSILFFVLLLSH